MSHPIAVIGAGLSGLYAAHLLKQAGEPVVLLEARDRVGGRVLSPGGAGALHRVDLGASWFWPSMNPLMGALLAELNLTHFPQHTQGAQSFEMADGTVRRHSGGWNQQPAAQRIRGGTQALVEALLQRVEEWADIKLSTQVVALSHIEAGVQIGVRDPTGLATMMASQVISTLPPRLLAQDLAMTPAWDESLRSQLLRVPTWMTGHAKFAAEYPRAFWRAEGMSGQAASQRGPLSEIHDASSADGSEAALFGFFGATADYRAHHAPEALASQCLAQLVRIFGPQAGEPTKYWLQDWAQQPLTAAALDRRPLNQHPLYRAITVPSDWWDHLWLAGTEQSDYNGGYLEGALDAAELAVTGLLARRRSVPVGLTEA